MAVPLVLYHTSGCHLCEKARDMLWPLLSSCDINLTEVDIAEHDSLIASYGVRIPVIASSDGFELDWPFDQEQIVSLIQSKS
jgi:glutaredoxin